MNQATTKSGGKARFLVSLGTSSAISEVGMRLPRLPVAMTANRDCLATYPPDPLPLAREGGGLPRVGKRGVKPLSINLFPFSFEGEGDKG